jgi:hypothetical protein
MNKFILLIAVLIASFILVACGGSDSFDAEARKSTRAAADYNDTVQKAYIAYYGRPADPGGLDYWAGRLKDANGDLTAIIDAFGDSSEFKTRFASLSNSQLITQIYQQLYNRDPDSGGLEYYSNLLSSGASSLQRITVNVMSGSQNEDLQKVNNKLAAANSFTSRLDNGTFGYPMTYAMSYIDSIDESENSIIKMYDEFQSYITSYQSPLLTHHLVNLNNVKEIPPLGWMNGKASHNLPVGHTGFTLKAPKDVYSGVLAEVYAPADITIKMIRQKNTRLAGSYDNTEYDFEASVNEDLTIKIDHLDYFADSIMEQIGSFSDCTETVNYDGGLYVECVKYLSLQVNAGDVIGTVGTHMNGFDIGAYDSRVNRNFISPEHSSGTDVVNDNHSVCFSDYYTLELKQEIESLLARDGDRRTDTPLCGKIMYDILGTMQGRWFIPIGDNLTMFEGTLALVPDNIDPSLQVVSVGDGIDSIPEGGYSFVALSEGNVNLDFSKANEIGRIYCYEPLTSGTYGHYLYNFTSGLSGFMYKDTGVHILIKLIDNETLEISGVPGSECLGENVMPDNATRFFR